MVVVAKGVHSVDLFKATTLGFVGQCLVLKRDFHFMLFASSLGKFILVSGSTDVLHSLGCSVLKVMALFVFDEWSYACIDLHRKFSPFWLNGVGYILTDAALGW